MKAGSGEMLQARERAGVRAVVFDLDGTLIDSAPDIWRAANAVLTEAGLPQVTFEQSRGFIGRGARVFVERMERAAGGKNESGRTEYLHRLFLQHYEHAHEGTRVYPHVPEVLSDLKGQGLALGLCTNKPMGPTRAVLRHLGWDAVFSAVVGGDTLPVAKPDPAPLHAVLSALDCAPDDCVYIGDSETDVETAERADIRFGLFTEGYRKAPPEALRHAFLFSDYRDLTGALMAQS